MNEKRTPDELTILAVFAVVALLGIVLGIWLGDVLGLVF